jgi:hypothetical protein
VQTWSFVLLTNFSNKLKPLSWNEIKDRALKFSKEWADTQNEEADAKPFLIEFFNVFGVSRKRVATFEERVMKLDEHDGYIDLFWKGNISNRNEKSGQKPRQSFYPSKRLSAWNKAT